MHWFRMRPIGEIDKKMLSQVAKINDHLYLSAASAITPEKVRLNQINLIINCTIELPNVSIPKVETVKVSVDDTPTSNIGRHFDRCSDLIKKNKEVGGRTLVHCMAGVSRSSSICIAYLMKHEGMKLKDAYNLVKSRRPIIRPNPGFFRQLIDYEKQLFGQSTVNMVPSPIGAIPDVYREETRNMLVVW